jgi:SAM-dependent methyltransferase
MFSASSKKQILELFNSIGKDDEFEVMFNNYKASNQLSLIDFINVMKYVKYRSTNDKLALYETITLDVFYNEYRISINGLTTVNNFLGLVHQKKNNNIVSVLASQYLDKDGFILIKKEKDKADKIDIDDLDIRFRKSKETVITDAKIIDMLTNLAPTESEKILYRYKQRLTLELEKSLLIDLTIIKTTDNINNISSSTKTYELEIDYSPLEKSVDKKKLPTMLDKILEEATKIKKVMVGNDIILSKDIENKIIEKYKQLTFGSSNDTNSTLYSSQPISAEVQHIVDTIPNKYSVTDKADGEKYQLFIHEGETYLISNNLHVKKLNRKIKDMDGTIVEGELISLGDSRKYVFMMFDCLFFKGDDVRNTIILRKRLEPLKDVAKKYGVVPYELKDYSGNFNIIDMKKYYLDCMKNFYSELNTQIGKINQNDVLFYPKLFLYPTGGSPSECFLFSDLIWISCTKNATVNCPYVLDGIIFTPLEQKYTKDKKEQRYPTFKYKPPHTNSIDCYITFERNKETNNYMDMFDNSIQDILPFKTYRVVNLFVGDNIAGKEQPVPFMKESSNHTIYLPVVDNMVHDIEGNLVQDKTVVELVYNTTSVMPHSYRWNILKTRWDKTESVMRHGKKYGNFKDVAEKVWRSIIQSVTVEEINILANPKTHDMQMKLLRSRLDSSIIVSERKQDIYYQKVTGLIKKMREFHNWIKSIIINTYCSPVQVGGKIVRQSMLDIGCGRGGDIMKIYHARIGDYVGIDPDFEGIYSATDGAISRYNYLKGKYPDFGKITYIQADGSIPFNSIAQSKNIPSLSNENKEAIDKIFTKNRKFDIISSQFVIHYLFGNATSINNLVDNINNFLKKDGYIILTLFDADRVHKSFDANNKITSIYTDKDGKRNILFDIVKKYSGEVSNTVGQPIDVHMSWLSEEGKYIEEYLVSRELMEKTMRRAGCRLIDTDLFANLYQINKPYFDNVIKYEENPKNKQFYEKIAEFYQDLSGADKESKVYSFLFRYYVFQKFE